MLPENCINDNWVVSQMPCGLRTLCFMRVLPSFLREHVQTKENPTQESLRMEFWSCLGVDPGWMETVVDLHPVWDGEKLLVEPAWANREDLIDTLSNIMFHLFQFLPFTLSRWCSVGRSCRRLLAALCVGLRGLVAWGREHVGLSDSCRHHMEYIQGNLAHFVAVAGLSSYLTDSLLLSLLEDDRVMMKVDEFQDIIVSECAWLQGVAPESWSSFSVVAGCSAADLKHDSIYSMMVAAGYFNVKVLVVAQSWPWKLVQGEPEEASAQLQRSDTDPDDHVVRKVLALLRIGAMLSVGLCHSNSDPSKTLQKNPYSDLHQNSLYFLEASLAELLNSSFLNSAMPINSLSPSLPPSELLAQSPWFGQMMAHNLEIVEDSHFILLMPTNHRGNWVDQSRGG